MLWWGFWARKNHFALPGSDQVAEQDPKSKADRALHDTPKSQVSEPLADGFLPLHSTQQT